MKICATPAAAVGIPLKGEGGMSAASSYQLLVVNQDGWGMVP